MGVGQTSARYTLPDFLSANTSTQNDGRWTGLLAMADEIRVFKEKLTAARELLMVGCRSFQEDCWI